MTRFFYILFVIFLIPMTAQAMDSLPRLHVENNRLELPDGTPLTLRGVSLCSLSWHNPKRLLGTLTQGQNGWHVNVVRLPVQPEEWEQTGPGKYLKERLDPAIRQCRAGGLYCIIDWHEIADWDDPETARKLESFWRIVAPRYANNPLIMYEILNEPIGPKALNRENWLAYRDTAQKWVDMIREKAPDTVLLVGSPHWSQMPSFAAQDPFKGNNLLYTLHLYHGWSPNTWDELFGNAAHKIPLFVSEWGWSSLLRNRLTAFYGTRDSYAEPLRAYFEARPQINWTAWSYDPSCGPAMLGTDKEMGMFVRDWLQSYK